MSRKRPYIRQRRTALWVGYVGILVGAAALYDAYERRGKERPFISRFLPV